MLTIGFTNTYYTLWSVSEPYAVHSGDSGFMKQDAYFIQNLSKDFETAKAKAALRGDYNIDLDQRGWNSFSSFDDGEPKFRKTEQPVERFPYGKLQGELIMESDNIWQLNRLFHNYANDAEIGARRGVLARRRLIELGELIRKDWSDSGVKFKYASKWKFNQLKQAEASGLWFNDKDKVTIEIKTISEYHFDTMYGTTYICIFEDRDGKIFKYKGANPPAEFLEFTKVKATIKHSAYNGVDETCLLRMSVVYDQKVEIKDQGTFQITSLEKYDTHSRVYLKTKTDYVVVYYSENDPLNDEGYIVGENRMNNKTEFKFV